MGETESVIGLVNAYRLPQWGADRQGPIPTQFHHQVTLRTNLTRQPCCARKATRFATRDFFESEYRDNTQPSSFLEVNQVCAIGSLDALAQPRIKQFLRDGRASARREVDR